MDHTCFIGLDLGTTNIKAAAISDEGEYLLGATGSMVYDTSGGKVEFCLRGFCKSAYNLIRELVVKLPAGTCPAGVCISSASGNTVLLGGDDEPLIPAISWLDKRQDGEIAEVMGDLDPLEVYRTVGWPLIDSFPLAHLCMLKRNDPGALERAAKVGMSSDYINLRLCGAWAIDHSTATTFYLQDQAAGRWHAPYLEALGIPVMKLPRLLPVGTGIGKVMPDAAADTLLPSGTPVYLGSFDHPSAAIGAGVTKEGVLLLSCGTSWVGFTPINGRERVLGADLLCDPFLATAAFGTRYGSGHTGCMPPQAYAGDGPWGGYFSLPNIGQRLDEYLCRLIPDPNGRFQAFDDIAAGYAPGSAGVEFDVYDEPPPDLGKMDINKAVGSLIENITILILRKLAALEKGGMPIGGVVMTGGPSRSPIWPRIISEAIGKPVSALPDGSYAGAVGAAKIARSGA